MIKCAIWWRLCFVLFSLAWDDKAELVRGGERGARWKACNRITRIKPKMLWGFILVDVSHLQKSNILVLSGSLLSKAWQGLFKGLNRKSTIYRVTAGTAHLASKWLMLLGESHSLLASKGALYAIVRHYIWVRNKFLRFSRLLLQITTTWPMQLKTTHAMHVNATNKQTYNAVALHQLHSTSNLNYIFHFPLTLSTNQIK